MSTKKIHNLFLPADATPTEEALRQWKANERNTTSSAPVATPYSNNPTAASNGTTTTPVITPVNSASTGRSYTSEEIGKMSPAERSAAWHGATPESQAALHAANQTALGGSHTYDHNTGAWLTKTPTKPRTYTVADISALAGGYNFDEAKIRNMFNATTAAEYLSKRIGNEKAQREYASKVGGFVNTLSDTMRQSLNKAVATGGSRGLAAAEAMQVAQDASMQASDEAYNLALERMQLDYDEAAAYAKNAKDAESLVMERKADALDKALQLGQIDAQIYAAGMSALGEYYYGSDAAKENKYGNIYNTDVNAATTRRGQDIEADTERYATDVNAATTRRGQDIEAETTRRGQDMTFNTNSMGQLLGILQSNNVTAEGRTALEGILRDFGFNIPEGSLQASPTPTYSSGGGGSSYYSNGSKPGDAGKIIENSYIATDAALLSNNKTAYIVGAYDRGVSPTQAEQEFNTHANTIKDTAAKLEYPAFLAWMQKEYGASVADSDLWWAAAGYTVPNVLPAFKEAYAGNIEHPKFITEGTLVK